MDMGEQGTAAGGACTCVTRGGTCVGDEPPGGGGAGTRKAMPGGTIPKRQRWRRNAAPSDRALCPLPDTAAQERGRDPRFPPFCPRPLHDFSGLPCRLVLRPTSPRFVCMAQGLCPGSVHTCALPPPGAAGVCPWPCLRGLGGHGPCGTRHIHPKGQWTLHWGFNQSPRSRDALEWGQVPSPPPDTEALCQPPPPPSRAPSLRPATVPLTPSTSFNGICNRQ